MNTPSNTPSIDAREELWQEIRYRGHVTMLPIYSNKPTENLITIKESVLAELIDQYATDRVAAYVEPHIRMCEEYNGLSFCKNCQLTRPKELQDK